VKKFQRLVTHNQNTTHIKNHLKLAPSLEESFTLISILQHPQKSRTVRVPIEIGSVPLTLPLREVPVFGSPVRV